MHRKLWKLIEQSPLQHLPVKILKGPAKGYWWTLAPVSGYWRGTVETDVEQAIQQCTLPAGSVFWDLGAHFGYFALVMATHTGPSGKVYAFEPDPSSFERLTRHIQMNKLTQLHAFEIAASDKEELTALIQEAGASTVSHLPYIGEEVPSSALKIQTKALDTMVDAEKLELPNFIKVDVEGHGGKALAGARKSIKKSKPSILVSFHSPGEIEASLQVLNALDYEGKLGSDVVTEPQVGMTVLYRSKK